MIEEKEIENGFKITEIGLLPKEWRLTNLGSILYEVKTRVKEVKNEFNDIPILSMTRHEGLILQSDKFDKRVASKNVNNYKVVKYNQIVSGFPLDEGVIYALKRFELGAVSPIYMVWNLCDKNIDINFLDLLLKTPAMIEIYKQLSSKTVHRRRIVSKTDFEKIVVKFPHYAEQQKIASLLSAVQEAKEKAENVIKATKELKKSMMKHLFTYGAVSVEEAEKVPLKKTGIGLIPEHWKVDTLSDFCLKIIDCPHSTPKFTPYGILCVRNFNVREGRFVLDKPFYTSEEEFFLRTKRCIPKEGDVLFSREAPIGEACLVPENTKLSLGQRMMLIRTNPEKLNNYFLVQTFYKKEVKNMIFACSSGVTAKHLNVGTVKQLKIQVPPLSEQRQISQILSTINEKIEAEENKKKALDALFKALLHNLMTGKIRVNNMEV